MPDGANADDNTDNTEQQDPGTPSDQVDQEILTAQVTDWWKSLFGIGDPHESGGGGTGGKFMFTDPEQLAAVIRKWEDERDAIKADQTAIAEAYYAIKDPAADNMSVGQANAARVSVATMYEHSSAMLEYAEGYLEKLRGSHTQMQTTEDGVRGDMNILEA